MRSEHKPNKPMTGQALLRRLLKQQWRALVLPLLTSIAISGMGTGTAIVSRAVVDAAVNRQISVFWPTAVGYALLLLGQIVCVSIQRYTIERCSAKMERQLQADYYAAFLSREYDAVRDYHSGVLQTHMTGDIYVVRDTMSHMLPTIASMACYLVFAFTALMVFDWRFASLFLVAGLITFLSSRLMRKRMKALHRAVQEAEEHKRNFQQETVNNLLVIKVFGAVAQVKGRMDDLQQAHLDIRCRRAAYSSIASFWYGLLLRGGYLLAMVWCGVLLLSGAITVGTLTAVLQLVSQVQRPFSSASGLLNRYYAALASAERLAGMFSLPQESQEQVEGEFRGLRGKGISFSYGRDDVLTDASFEIQSGEFVALTGRSGIGKSTLCRLLLGTHAVSGGRLELLTDTGSYPAGSATRRYFSYLPQGTVLFSGTLRENFLLVKPDATDAEIAKALQIACAEEFVCALPQGLDTPLGERGLGLSEGQLQRIVLACAVLHHAPVLLLDEATSALDENTEAQVLKNLRQVPGLTCVMVTHRSGGIRLCDRRLYFADGKILEEA